MQPVWRDRPVVAFMVAQTVIWASIFYSFPALVLRWQAEFGWTTTTIMGAFSLAIAMQGLAAPAFGRLIDRGSAPLSFPLGALAGAACLIAMTQVTGPVGFYGVWATMGMAMGLTLYDPCFSLVTRARGPRARHAITAITLAAGFASTLAYPLTAIVSDLAGWRAALWTLAGLVLVVNLPLARFAAVKLEQEVADQAAMTPDAPVTDGPAPNQLPGFWWLAMGFALAALGTGIVMSHLFPMMAALGVTGSMAVLAGSMIGPSQVAGRVLLMLSGTRFSAMTMSVTALLAVALAALFLGAAAWWAVLVFAFAIAQGLGYGLTSILRPVVTRDVLGQAQFGRIAGAVARPSLLAFAVAPGVAAILADTMGYGAVIAVCAAAPLAGALCLLRLRRLG